MNLYLFAFCFVSTLVVLLVATEEESVADEATLSRFLSEAPGAWTEAQRLYDQKGFEFKEIRDNETFVLRGRFEHAGNCYRMSRAEAGTNERGKSWTICNQFYVAYLSENDVSDYTLHEVKPKSTFAPEKKDADIPVWKTNGECLKLCYPSFQYGGTYCLFEGFRNMPGFSAEGLFEVSDAKLEIGSDGEEVVVVKIDSRNTKITLKLLPARHWCVLESETIGRNDVMASKNGEVKITSKILTSFEYDGDSFHPSKKHTSLQVGPVDQVDELVFGELQSADLSCDDCRLTAFGLPEPPDYTSSESSFIWVYVIIAVLLVTILVTFFHRFL